MKPIKRFLFIVAMIMMVGIVIIVSVIEWIFNTKMLSTKICAQLDKWFDWAEKSLL